MTLKKSTVKIFVLFVTEKGLKFSVMFCWEPDADKTIGLFF